MNDFFKTQIGNYILHSSPYVMTFRKIKLKSVWIIGRKLMMEPILTSLIKQEFDVLLP